MYSTEGEIEIAPRRCAPGPGMALKLGRASSAMFTLPEDPRYLKRLMSSRKSAGRCSASMNLLKVSLGSTLEEIVSAQISSPLARTTPLALPSLIMIFAMAACVRISTPASRAASPMAFEIAPVPPRANTQECADDAGGRHGRFKHVGLKPLIEKIDGAHGHELDLVVFVVARHTLEALADD